ncbi:MAG: hypothetical protein HC821_02255 [Lewinella sp.]|nr:hypothetical protein [Lewinella sp.]
MPTLPGRAPLFTQLAAENPSRPLKIILVSLDRAAEHRQKLPAFLLQHKLQLPVIALTDPRQASWMPLVHPQWIDGGIPVTIIYRRGLRSFFPRPFKTYLDLASATAPLLR